MAAAIGAGAALAPPLRSEGSGRAGGGHRDGSEREPGADGGITPILVLPGGTRAEHDRNALVVLSLSCAVRITGDPRTDPRSGFSPVVTRSRGCYRLAPVETGTGAVQRNLTPRPCTGARFTPEPSAPCGAALRGRSEPEQPGEIPHLRVSLGAGKQNSRELKYKRQRPNGTVQARPGRTAQSLSAPAPQPGAVPPGENVPFPRTGGSRRKRLRPSGGTGPGLLGGAGSNSLGQERTRFPSGRCQRTAVPNLPVFPEPRGVRARGPRRQHACFPQKKPGDPLPHSGSVGLGAERARSAAPLGVRWGERGRGRVPVSGTGNGPAPVGSGRRTGAEPVQHHRCGQLRAGHVAPGAANRTDGRRNRDPRRAAGNAAPTTVGLSIAGPAERCPPRFGGARPVPEPPSPGSGAVPRPSRHRAPVPGALIGTGGWRGGGDTASRSRGGHPWGRAALYQRRPTAGRALGRRARLERRNERRNRSGAGRGTRGAGRGGDRAAAPGRKESGEGGGVNIEYLLIAVEGRSVITGPSSPGRGAPGAVHAEVVPGPPAPRPERCPRCGGGRARGGSCISLAIDIY